jgi:choline dehydrogenase-like flavoprotein
MAQGPLPIETMSIVTGAKGLWGAALHEEMLRYNHLVGLKMVGEQLSNEDNRVTLADDKDQYGLRIPRISYSWGENDKVMIRHALDEMSTSLALVGAKDLFRQENDMNHLAGTVRMGFTSEDSVIDADCRSWDIPNLFICDGSVFPTTGGVNPSLTITAIGMRTAVRIGELARRGEL